MIVAAPAFLFLFGFESPVDHVTNISNGTDFESSWGVWIAAENADAALAWGRQVAEEFVRRLFEQSGSTNRSWTQDGFAHWISDEPSKLERASRDATIPIVPDGQLPDFSWALNHWRQ